LSFVPLLVNIDPALLSQSLYVFCSALGQTLEKIGNLTSDFGVEKVEVTVEVGARAKYDCLVPLALKRRAVSKLSSPGKMSEVSSEPRVWL